MQKPSVPEDLCYVEGESCEDYLHDMRICQLWANINRKLIAHILMDILTETFGAVVYEESTFESVHNYIGDDNIIRKGAISAHADEICIIPLIMPTARSCAAARATPIGIIPLLTVLVAR